MAVRNIAYADLYVKDKQFFLDYFVDALGFLPVADCVETTGSSVLVRHGSCQIAITSGPATWRFLDLHGDGVADLALVCDDVAATRATALAAGATEAAAARPFPVVSGFGDVTHTLLPAAADGGTGLPPGRAWVPRPAAGPVPGQARITLLDHVAVCVEGERLQEYADFYRDGFGMDRYFSEYVDLGTQAMDSIVVRSASELVTFTLVAPVPGKDPGQLDAFLSRNSGPGVQHLAFLVEEIVPAVTEYRERGVDFLQTPDAYYDLLIRRFPAMGPEIAGLREAGVLVDRDEWGHLLQLFSRSPHERNTLFYELIQRRGSRGFGSNNIRALYEAVDQDRLTA